MAGRAAIVAVCMACCSIFYLILQVVFWILSWLYTINFVLSIFRSAVDGDENWADCNDWTDVPATWSYDYEYLTMDAKRPRPAVRRKLASRRRRTATTRRLRTKHPLSESIKNIF